MTETSHLSKNVNKSSSIIGHNNANSESSTNSSSHEEDFWTVWSEFKTALYDVRNDFHEYFWIKKLARSAFQHFILNNKNPFQQSVRNIISACYRWILHVFPFLAIGLIIFVVFSYFAVLREFIVEPWCSRHDDGDHHSCYQQLFERRKCVRYICLWTYLHDSIVIYLSSMILFFYIFTVFTSPGVVVCDLFSVTSAEGSQNCDRVLTLLPSTKIGKGGGFFHRISYHISINDELERMSLYKGTITDPKTTDTSLFFPSPFISFCSKCNIHRPPRAHHCKICNRCILQMDHHCIWMNNCIGYNNYRSFFLTVAYLTIGCWYGMILCAEPFKRVILELIQLKGYDNFSSQQITNIIHFPSFRDLWIRINTIGLDPVDMVKIIFPLLFGFALLLTPLFCSHIQYILSSRTTLEHLIDLNQKKYACMEALTHVSIEGKQSVLHDRGTKKSARINPFDQGGFENCKQVLGHNLFLVLVPLLVRPSRPYIPFLKKLD